MNTGLETRWGGGADNPTIAQLRAALSELDTPDSEHPNTWLVDDEGWIVDVYESGLVLLGHKFKKIAQRSDVSREEALQLWILLQQGKYEEIRERLSAQHGTAL
jgi:hypothetical protein